MKTKVAILGVGRWGTHLLRNFHQHPQAEVIAVVDPHSERLAACTEKLGLNNQSITISTEWSGVRQLEGLEAVVIATPASTHYPLILDALELGYHVLAEKPLTLDPKECVELCRLAKKQQKQLLVDHTYLFNSVVTQGREVVKTDKLGALRYGYASRTHLGPVRQDVDALWDLAIHDIAIFNYWLGEKPIQVQAHGSVWLQPGLADLVWVTLTYPSGFQAYIHLCWLNNDKQRRLVIVGEKGSLIFDEMLKDAPLTLQKGYFEQQDNYFIPTGQKSEVIPTPEVEPLKQVCDRFLENISSGKDCSVSSGWVGAELVQILSCLRESLEQGGRIVQVPSHQD